MADQINILHLEDSPSDALLVEWALKKGEVEATCHRVEDLSALKAALERDDWHLVLSDYNVPGLAFEDALAAIRKRRPDLPLIVVSGCLGEERAVELLKQGVTDFVLKGTLARLVPSIRQSLREAAENRARIAAERLLRESERRLRMTLDAADLVVWDWSPSDGSFEETGPAGLVFGRDEAYAHRSLDGFLADIHPEDRPSVHNAMLKGAEGSSSTCLDIEFRVQGGDGSMRWLEAVGSRLCEDVDTGPRLLGIVRDITKRKEMVAGLNDQLKLRHALMEAIPSPIFYKDVTGRYLGCNKAFEALFERQREQIVGKTVAELTSKENASLHAKVDADLIAGIETDKIYDAQFVKSDGTVVDMTVSKAVYALSTGAIAGTVGIMTDITERNRAERKLRQLAEAVRQSPSSIVITDTNGNIEYVNPRFIEVSGYSYEEAVGSNPRILRSGYTPESVYRQLWQIISSGSIWRGELYNRRKNGTLYWENVSISPVMADGSNITHYVGIKHDITEEKAQFTALLEAKERAEAANTAKSQFLAMMNHELHTPLNAIIGFSEIMTMESKSGKLDVKHQEYIQLIAESGKSLLSSLDHIISLAKASSGDIELHMQHISVAHFVKSAITTVRERAETACIHLIAPCPDPSIYLEGDEQALHQALVLILANGIKFSKRDGKVVLQTKLDEHGLSLMIEDDGIGIAAADIQRVMEPFEQAESSFNRRFEGIGVGLPLAKRLIEHHGGTLRLESVIGVGTTVTIDLPAERISVIPSS